MSRYIIVTENDEQLARAGDVVIGSAGFTVSTRRRFIAVNQITEQARGELDAIGARIIVEKPAYEPETAG